METLSLHIVITSYNYCFVSLSLLPHVYPLSLCTVIALYCYRYWKIGSVIASLSYCCWNIATVITFISYSSGNIGIVIAS